MARLARSPTTDAPSRRSRHRASDRQSAAAPPGPRPPFRERGHRRQAATEVRAALRHPRAAARCRRQRSGRHPSARARAPVGTYTGWNLRRPEVGAPDKLARWSGSLVPFAASEATRRAAGDPRPSLEARYASRADYRARIEAAARALVTDGFLLADDSRRSRRAPSPFTTASRARPTTFPAPTPSVTEIAPPNLSLGARLTPVDEDPATSVPNVALIAGATGAGARETSGRATRLRRLARYRCQPQRCSGKPAGNYDPHCRPDLFRCGKRSHSARPAPRHHAPVPHPAHAVSVATPASRASRKTWAW